MSRDRDSSRRSASGAKADRILEQALKHELGAAGTPPAGAPALRSSGEGRCLDAETLGAWVDGGLDPAAMAAAEVHVANCARCQALVGTTLKSAPGTLGTPGTLSFWKWWLAPIAAGVTAVTLWTVIPEQQQIAQAPPQAKAADAVAVQPPVTAEAAPPAAQAPAAQAPAAAPEQFGARDNLAAAARDDRRREQDKEERKEDTAVSPAPPAPAAPPAAQLGAVAAPAPAERVATLQKSMTAAAIEIATLDPSLGWRVVGDRIERSDDAGKTWTVKRQSAGDGIVAGSAPSNSVGWFVGRAGRVLLTTDSGATFADVSLAEPLDLASVAAIDARSASIYSVVGRRFRTGDGGRTWRPF